MYSFICFKVLADKMFTIFTTLCAVGVVMPTTAVIISHPLQILAFWIVKYSNESLLWDYILISIRYVFVYRDWTQWYEILKNYSLVINTTFDFIWSSLFSLLWLRAERMIHKRFACEFWSVQTWFCLELMPLFN